MGWDGLIINDDQVNVVDMTRAYIEKGQGRILRPVLSLPSGHGKNDRDHQPHLRTGRAGWKT